MTSVESASQAPKDTNLPTRWPLLMLICQIAGVVVTFYFLRLAERHGLAYGGGFLQKHHPMEWIGYLLFSIVYVVQGPLVGVLLWLYWPRIWSGMPWLLVSPAGMAAYVSGGCAHFSNEPSAIYLLLPLLHYLVIVLIILGVSKLKVWLSWRTIWIVTWLALALLASPFVGWRVHHLLELKDFKRLVLGWGLPPQTILVSSDTEIGNFDGEPDDCDLQVTLTLRTSLSVPDIERYYNPKLASINTNADKVFLNNAGEDEGPDGKTTVVAFTLTREAGMDLGCIPSRPHY